MMDFVNSIAGRIILGVVAIAAIFGIWTAVLLWPIDGIVAAEKARLAEMGPEIEVGIYNVEKRPSCPGVAPEEVKRAYLKLRLDVERDLYDRLDRIELLRIDPRHPDTPKLMEQYNVVGEAAGQGTRGWSPQHKVIQGLMNVNSEREVPVELPIRCSNVVIATPYMHIIPSPDWEFFRQCRFEMPLELAVDEPELAALEGREVDPTRIAEPVILGITPPPLPEAPPEETAAAETGGAAEGGLPPDDSDIVNDASLTPELREMLLAQRREEREAARIAAEEAARAEAEAAKSAPAQAPPATPAAAPATPVAEAEAEEQEEMINGVPVSILRPDLSQPALWRVTIFDVTPAQGDQQESATVLLTRDYPDLKLTTHKDAYQAQWPRYVTERTGSSIQVEVDVPAGVRFARLRTAWMVQGRSPEDARILLTDQAGKTVRQTITVEPRNPIYLGTFFEADIGPHWVSRGTLFEDPSPMFRCQ